MDHPNKAPFHGILTTIDAPSDKALSGARGHKIVLTKDAAEDALPSLLGMAVDYRPGWDGHDATNKIGVIDSAEISGKNVIVHGYIFKRDLPEVVGRIETCAEELGMSYELADARVEDMRDEVWKLTRVTFTGAAILLKSKAAYRNTEFSLD